MRSLWLALGLAALAPLAASALMPAPDAPADPVELAVGERRVLLIRPADHAHVEPRALADVTLLGPSTAVLTPGQAGSGLLILGSGTVRWSVPLDVRPRHIEPLADDAPVPPGPVQNAPPPFQL